MEQIISSPSNPLRPKLFPKVKGYQGDLQRARRDLQRASTAVSNQSNRDDLFSGAQQDYQVSDN